MLTPSVLKMLCERAGMRPEKSAGQNFLVNRAVLDRIVAAVDPQPTDTILEVGAGFGVLTTALAERLKNGERYGRVIAVERDRHIVPILRELVAEYGNVEIVEGDVLRWLRGDHAMPVIARSRRSEKPTAWLRALRDGIGDAEERGRRALCMAKQSRSMCTEGGIASSPPAPRNDIGKAWKLAANLPYSITSDFLRSLFDRVADGSLPPPERAVLLLQREVVDRLCADPKQRRAHRNVGVLTILTQLHCIPHRVALVPPGAFWPPPQVESAVVVLDHWRAPAAIALLLDGVSRDTFLQFVHHCFMQRRRQLGAIMRVPRTGRRSAFQIPDSRFREAGIDPTARPETLTLAQWIALARALRS